VVPPILHFVVPWLSNADIQPGERWDLVISNELEAADFGVICLTPENINAPWILFEAGALAKSMQGGRVIPLLFDLEPKDISESPLGRFQAVKFDRSAIFGLVCYINKLWAQPVPQDNINRLFDLAWPKIEEEFTSAVQSETGHNRAGCHEKLLGDLVTSVQSLEVKVADAIEGSIRTRHLLAIRELARGLGPRDPIRILLFASAFREIFPWLYELGVDAYRSSHHSNHIQAEEAQRRFFYMARQIYRGPLAADDEVRQLGYTVMPELDQMLDRYSGVEINLPFQDR